jgi:hypothetical protein
VNLWGNKLSRPLEKFIEMISELVQPLDYLQQHLYTLLHLQIAERKAAVQPLAAAA